MTSSSPWITRVAPIGPVGVGSVLWRSRGALQVTIVVKARFAMRDQDEAVLVDPLPLRRRDQHDDDDPTRSLRRAADVVPYREEADVWLTGHACAPLGRSLSVQVVRLGIYCAGDALLDKTLHVVGDRRSYRAAPTPFERMPLVWERAYGGIGFEDNPVGVGADERALVPNVVLPDEPERPAGYGPISRYWWLRRRNVPTALRQRVEGEVPDVPDGFDWSYFQAAPADQRIRYLQGDEWLVLDGLHPERLRLQTRLPKVAGVARVLPVDPSGEDLGDEVAMVGDCLAIDADTQTCSVTWRGAIPIDSERMLPDMLIAGGLRIRGRGVDWLSAYRVGQTPAAPVAPGAGPDALDRSDVTIVSTAAHLAGDEPPPPSDPLAQTTVDALPEDYPAAVEPSHRRTIANGVHTSSVATIDRPRYPRSTPDTDETTDTGVQTIPGPDLDGVELTQPLPLVTDTEPGAPPDVPEDDLPWVHEPAVEPAGSSGPPRRPRLAADPPVTLESAVVDDEDDEPLTAIDLPLPGEVFPPHHRTVPGQGGKGPAVAPLGKSGERRRAEVPPPRPRHPSRPPEPVDSAAFEATLRSAGASEADIAALLAALDAEQQPDDPDD